MNESIEKWGRMKTPMKNKINEGENSMNSITRKKELALKKVLIS
jgi:hypothetical protein